MVRTLLLGTLLLAATACFAQTAGSPSVAVGGGQVVTLIPLKYLDPVDAADLLAALGYPGTIIPINPPHSPGESMGSWGNSNTGAGGHQRGRAGNYSSANRNNNGSGYGQGYNNNGYNGYGGYQNAGQTNGQYPGYQSPYSNR